MAAGRLKTIAAAVAIGVIDPFAGDAGGLEPRNGLVEFLGADRAPARVPECALFAVRQHQAVFVVVSPAPQVDRLRGALYLCESHDIDKELCGLVHLGRDEFNVRKMREQNF